MNISGKINGKTDEQDSESELTAVRHFFLAITQKVLGAHQIFLQILIPLVKSFHLSYV